MRILLILLIPLNFSLLGMQTQYYMVEGKQLFHSVSHPSLTQITTCLWYGDVTVLQDQITKADGKIEIIYRGSVEIIRGYNDSLHPDAAEKSFKDLIKYIPQEKK